MTPPSSMPSWKKPRVRPAPPSAMHLFSDRKSTRLNSSHGYISYAVFCLKKKTSLASSFFMWTCSFVAAVVLSLLTTLVVGVLVELTSLRTLSERDHLDQVLATFGLILFFNELIAILWGRAAIYTATPAAFAGYIELAPRLRYPTYRAAVILVGLAVAALLYVVVTRTRLGMLIRAGASNRTMVAALGVNIRLLYTVVFGFGAALAGLAGLMAGAIYAVQPRMGEQILIPVFVVIVIRGIRSTFRAPGGAGPPRGGGTPRPPPPPPPPSPLGSPPP